MSDNWWYLFFFRILLFFNPDYLKNFNDSHLYGYNPETEEMYIDGEKVIICDKFGNVLRTFKP